jgi:phenylacetate-CoA ligase
MNEWFAKNVVYRSIQSIRGENVLKYLSHIQDIPQRSQAEIRGVQKEKLANVLENAYHHIPYYRRLFNRYDVQVEALRLPEDLSKIPVLSKEMFRQDSSLFIHMNQRGRVSKETTSGTVGNPLAIAIDRHKSAFIRAVMFRNYGWYNIDVGDKQARFWGMPSASRLHLRESLKDFCANRIRLSAFNVNDDAFRQFVKKLQTFRPKYFYGYPSLLYKFSQWLGDNKVEMNDLSLSAVICTGEVLYDFQRKGIESAFQCNVVNEYGTTETGIIAFECREGNLHINSDHVYLESLKSGEFSDTGSLVVTELNNFYNPLIRYQLGDVGSISEEPCRCGVGFPILKNLTGREGNFIVTDANKYIFSAILSYTFKDGIKQFQGIQNKKGELIVKIVRDETLTDAMLTNYKRSLSNVLGERMKIIFEDVPQIEAERSGKLRYFISNLRGYPMDAETNRLEQ